MNSTPSPRLDATSTDAPAPTPAAKRVRLAAGGFALALLVFAGYWPSLRGGFVWDDLVLVAKNPLATGELNLRTVWLGTDFSLATVTTWLQWLAFGKNPTGYRLMNALLHSLSAILAWRCLTRLKIPGAWLGAALFAVHPVAAASVAWISELKNTLSLPFFLLSAWAFWVHADRSQAERSANARGFYALSLASFFLALLAKTSTVMLPVVLLAGVWWRHQAVSRRTWRQVSPHFALALVFGLLTIWFQSQQAIRGLTVQSEDFSGRLAAAGNALWFYLGKALLPVNLCLIYPRWETITPEVITFLPLLLWLGMLALAWRFRAGWARAFFMAIGCFTALLFPVLGHFDMYFMVFARVSDHFAYLSLLAIMPLVAAGVSSLPERRIARTVGALLLALLVFLTWERAQTFASDETLWQDTIAKNPRAWNAYNNLACNLAERGELAAAIKNFQTSVELNPRNADAHRNLGKALTLTGRFAAAEPHLRTARELKPSDAETLVTYATGLTENHRPAEAVELLRKAIIIKPEIPYRLQLAPLLAATGDYAAAAAEMQSVLEVQPDSFEALNNLAWIRATCPDAAVRDGQAAVRLAKEACRISGGQQPIPFGTLAAAYAETGDFTNAVTAAQTAIELATAAGNTPFATMNRQLQRLYQTGRPFHTLPPER